MDMRQLTIQIPDSRYSFFLELIQSFDFVSLKSGEVIATDSTDADTDEVILNNIRQGIEEMKLINQGKLKTRPARELIDEL
jgi:hypothetical protein